MKNIFVLLLIFCSFSCHAESSIEQRRSLARIVSNMFDTLHCDKIVFSYTDAEYFVLIGTPTIKEYLVSFSQDTIIRKTGIYIYKNNKYKKHLKKFIEEASPIFGRENYMHGSIVSCPDDSVYCGKVKKQYFGYFDDKNNILLEYYTIDNKCRIIKEGLWNYLFLRLLDESSSTTKNPKEPSTSAF